MRQRIVRLALAGGVLVLALLLLLATCGGDGGSDESGGSPKKPAAKSSGPSTRLTVPPAYSTAHGWEIIGAAPEFAVSRPTGRLAFLVTASGNRYQLRTLDAASGKLAWSGPAWRPPDPLHFPKLISVAAADRQFFVTWAYGKVGDGLSATDTFVSLDVYDAADGSRRRAEVPWSGAPKVTATGPDILISDGRANSAMIDPATGEVSRVASTALKYPKGCPACKQLTEVRGQTGQGLLVSGAEEFWVRGGWFSRNVAPKGTDRRSGVPTSVAPGWILAKWQLAKGAKRAASHELWAVHEAATGKPVVSVECHRPAIEPGRYPEAVVAASDGYLVAGNLGFDLGAAKGFCLEDEDGSASVTLASVTDRGVAYGATNVRDASDALDGGGEPVEMELTSGTVSPLSPNVRLPGMETAGVGLFPWTDRRDRLHLIGYPRSG
ncbi:hypothetical protein F0344_27015 [Streptomyces finlayi]|uniref:PQQ-binding-like beta-propeller repeat protein n=1 Tax=Streptomyces finlayi TaxID=67296 RepID=A0A7G7BQZ4_9ACTN|nr:hypothetical protein [Streptomyces finlayi]QNE77759.1 hypothetical protein F0344_27015 [Streptomyces finlayi]